MEKASCQGALPRTACASSQGSERVLSSSFCSRHLAPGRLRTVWQRDLSKRKVACRLSKGRSQPAESSWEAEFAKYADPQRVQKMSQHLELTWKVSKNMKPKECEACSGTGRQPCSWCNSTGAMRLGEYLFCSVDSGCKPCPICRSKGHIPCDGCKGTGYRASWLSP